MCLYYCSRLNVFFHSLVLILTCSNRAKTVQGNPPQWNMYCCVLRRENLCYDFIFSFSSWEYLLAILVLLLTTNRYLGSKQPILLVLFFFPVLLILINCITAWAVVILRLQSVFYYKIWFQIMILWFVSFQIVTSYFWFLTKEESCQSALKQLNYFWVKTMQGKMLSPNIKILLPFNRCYLGRPMSYPIVKMLTVWHCWKIQKRAFFGGHLFAVL